MDMTTQAIDKHLREKMETTKQDIQRVNGREFNFDARLEEAKERLATESRKARHKVQLKYLSNCNDLLAYRCGIGAYGSENIANTRRANED